MDLGPKWLGDYGLVELVINGNKTYLFNSVTGLNTQLSSYLVNNKHTCRLVLEDNHLPNIPYLVDGTPQLVSEFFDIHKKVIAKPVLGSGSRNVEIISSSKKLRELELDGLILEKYIEGKQLRYLVLDNKVIAVHKREFETEIYHPEKGKRISLPARQWSGNLIELSTKITEVFSLRLAAIDIIIDSANTAYVLEINSAPGIYRFYFPDKGPSLNLAQLILKAQKQLWQEK